MFDKEKETVPKQFDTPVAVICNLSIIRNLRLFEHFFCQTVTLLKWNVSACEIDPWRSSINDVTQLSIRFDPLPIDTLF